MNFKSIKVYNVGEYFKKLELNNQNYNIVADSKLAVIEGGTGIIIVNAEGCGSILKSVESKYEFDLIQEDKIHFGKSDYVHIMSVKEIINNIPHEEMTLVDFMSNWQYKMRIKDNLIEILGHMKRIGLNSSKYCTKSFITKNYEGRYV